MLAALKRLNVARVTSLALALLLLGCALMACSSAATATLPAPSNVAKANPTPSRVDVQGTPVPDVNMGAPVMLNGQVLWRIIEGRGNETATERAARISA